MKILVATDGSEFGKAAVAQACSLAAGVEKTEIMVVSAYLIPGPYAVEPFIAAPIYTQELFDSIAGVAANIADSALSEIRARCPGISASAKTIMGRPAEAIIEEAASWKADLIVVGSHGHGFWARAWLGSVSASVVNHAPCSVLVVRRKEQK
jgi:nucleotide-binding universal stress UspA family protein